MILNCKIRSSWGEAFKLLIKQCNLECSRMITIRRVGRTTLIDYLAQRIVSLKIINRVRIPTSSKNLFSQSE